MDVKNKYSRAVTGFGGGGFRGAQKGTDSSVHVEAFQTVADRSAGDRGVRPLLLTFCSWQHRRFRTSVIQAVEEQLKGAVRLAAKCYFGAQGEELPFAHSGFGHRNAPV